MPKRTDITSVLVIGSGPIVIGQAAEFDYSGTQACRVLREEGIRVILVNSNPATIMTDPDFADATYIEPITTPVLEKIIAKERPDAVLPTLGGQTALNAAIALDEAGILAKYGVELIGAKVDAIRRGEDRQIFKDLVIEAGAEVAKSRIANERRGRAGARRRARLPDGRPPLLHDGRPRLGLRAHAGGAGPVRRAGRRRLHGRRGAPRGVDPRLEGVRARADAGHGRQHGRRLLDRERRPGRRAHRRLDHRRARDDADRPRVPAHARHRDRHHPARRRRHRRLQHPVRGRADHRPDHRHRDEPARLALLRPRVEGDRLPDREDRREARDRLPARRDPERHHQGHAGELRADARLRRREGAAVRVREVPGRRPRADDDHEVGRRGDGDRPHVRRRAAEGAALAREARLLLPLVGRRRSTRRRCSRRSAPRPTAASCRCSRRSSPARRVDEVFDATRIDPWFLDAIVGDQRARRGRSATADDLDEDLLRLAKEEGFSDAQLGAAARRSSEAAMRSAPARRGRPPGLQDRRHLRGRVPGAHAVPLLDLRQRDGGRRLRRPQGDHPGQRSEPDRAGHRVRLLVRARGVRAEGRRVRDGDDQLQPGDGLDRLRHLRPPVLRAADARGRARGRSTRSPPPARSRA